MLHIFQYLRMYIMSLFKFGTVYFTSETIVSYVKLSDNIHGPFALTSGLGVGDSQYADAFMALMYEFSTLMPP